MNIVFRCDSSTEIGSGHLIRCITLGQILHTFGAQVHYYYKDLKGAINPSSLWSEAHSHLIPASLSSSEEVPFLQEKWAHLKDIKLIVLDHYGLEESWEAHFFSTYRLWVIDDLAIRKHHCHILHDSNYRTQPEDAYRHLVPSNCKLLLGPKFTLLRSEFVATKARQTTTVRNTFRKALAFFGGTDPMHESLRFANNFAWEQTSLQWSLLITPYNENYQKLKDLKTPPNLKIIYKPKSMAELFAENDLYFGSGGTVTWERAYLGLSGYTCSVADNQIPASKALAQAGYQEFLGASSQIDFSRFFAKIESDLKSSKLHDFSRKSSELVAPLTREIVEPLLQI